MENHSKQVVIDFLNSVKSLDLEKVRVLLDDKVCWFQPGNNQISGLKRSPEEVFEMVGRMFELSSNTLKLKAFNTLSVNGNRIACQLNWMAEKTSGDKLDVDNIDVYTVDNGKITEIEIFSADQTQEDNFWQN